MKATQNVTLSLPKDLLRKAKMLAIQRNTSLSGLLTSTLTDIIARVEGYDAARQRSLALLNKGFDLDSQGKIDWDRESLHER